MQLIIDVQGPDYDAETRGEIDIWLSDILHNCYLSQQNAYFFGMVSSPYERLLFKQLTVK